MSFGLPDTIGVDVLYNLQVRYELGLAGRLRFVHHAHGLRKNHILVDSENMAITVLSTILAFVLSVSIHSINSFLVGSEIFKCPPRQMDGMVSNMLFLSMTFEHNDDS